MLGKSVLKAFERALTERVPKVGAFLSSAKRQNKYRRILNGEIPYHTADLYLEEIPADGEPLASDRFSSDGWRFPGKNILDDYHPFAGRAGFKAVVADLKEKGVARVRVGRKAEGISANANPYSESADLDLEEIASYKGGRIAVFADTSCFLGEGPGAGRAGELIGEIRHSDYYTFIELPTLKRERANGGINRLTLGEKTLAGIKDFRTIYRNLSDDLVDSRNLETFFNVALSYFVGLQRNVLDAAKEGDIVSAMRDKGYLSADGRFYRKLVHNLHAGKANNLFADHILTSCAMMYSAIMPGSSPTLIITGDSDISTMGQLLLDDILPRYLATITIEDYPQESDDDQHARYEGLVRSAREHIAYFRGRPDAELLEMGSIYDYNKRSFHSFRILSATAGLLRGENPYRGLKTATINQMEKQSIGVPDAYHLLKEEASRLVPS